MRISVLITVLNEDKSIFSLLNSLVSQSVEPEEIIIVDGGSSDTTIEIIKHFQKKYKNIKLLLQKSSRAEGRNIGIEVAEGEVVAVTDAGCVPHKDWLERLTDPLKNEEIDMVAGFYKMVYRNDFERAETLYLGVKPSKFNIGFLPSSRSVAFKKALWEEVGGYPENLKGTAEDSVFNFKVLKTKANISRVKNAIVEWGMPNSLQEFFLKLFNYAKGDAESRIWWYPTKGLSSHNIKVLLVILRYLAFLILLILAIKTGSYLGLLVLGLFFYLIWIYRKNYLIFKSHKVSLWGIILQITADIAVVSGFLNGLFKRHG